MAQAQKKSLITDEMRAFVGHESIPLVSRPVSVEAIVRCAIAMYWPEIPPRLFWDEEYAQRTRWGGIIAPADFVPFAWMVGATFIGPQPTPLDARQSETIESRSMVPPGAPEKNFLGTTDTEYFRVIRPGDVITSVVRMTDIYEREGRLGQMLFYTTEDHWTNQRGELIKTWRMTNIRF